MTLVLTNEDLEILNDFVNESLEGIEAIEPLLVELESEIKKGETVGSESIDKIFRVFHSLKGSAAYLDLSIIVSITHEAETLLDLIRKDKIAFRTEHVQVMMKLCDLFNELLPTLRDTLSLDKYTDVKTSFIMEVSKLIQQGDPAQQTEEAPLEEAPGDEMSAEKYLPFVTECRKILEKVKPQMINLQKQITKSSRIGKRTVNHLNKFLSLIKASAANFELVMFVTVAHQTILLFNYLGGKKLEFTGKEFEMIESVFDFYEALLTNLEKDGTPGNYEEREQDLVHQLWGSTQYHLARIKEKTSPASDAQASLDASTTNDQPESLQPQPAEAVESEDPFDNFFTDEMRDQFIVESLELTEEVEHCLLQLEKKTEDLETAAQAFRAIHSLKGNAALYGYQDIGEICHAAESFLDTVRSDEQRGSQKQYSFLLSVLDHIRDSLKSSQDGDIVGIENIDAILEEAKVVLLETTTSDDQPKPDVKKSTKDTHKSEAGDKFNKANAASTDSPASTNSAEQEKMQKTAPAPAKEAKPKRAKTAAAKSVRKETSEVIRVNVAKLNELMDLVGEIVIAESMVAQHPELLDLDLPGFEKATSHLQKNIRSLQEIATSLRMIPLSGLFRKMIRLVRDLSNKVSKDVELVIRGDETEVDRSVLENISDPLVHIIRNCVDHGIEPPEERKAAGKNPCGQVLLEAKQSGSEILVIIEDDGRGLNREKLLAKAEKKGLVQGNGDRLTDAEVWKLIFAPGFSTAEALTDISGRGVGMDVVRRNIESIRGRIDIKSEMGKGTRITMGIPLTTAIVDGMLMRVGNAIYALSTVDIKESLQVSEANTIDMIGGEEVVKIREHLYPVLRIHELHNLPVERKGLSEGLVVLTEYNGNSLCIFVDELIGQKQLVAKALPDYVGDVAGVSGCTILGNGEICLILDISSLIAITQGARSMSSV